MTTLRSQIDAVAAEAPGTRQTVRRQSVGPVTVVLVVLANGSPALDIEVKRADGQIVGYTTATLPGLVDAEVGRRLTADEAQRVRFCLAKLLVATCPDAATIAAEARAR